MIIKTFRFYDEDVYKDEIFSILSIARMNISVILAVKLDGRRHSTAGFSENVIVAKTSYQMLMLNGERAEPHSTKITVLTFLVEKLR